MRFSEPQTLFAGEMTHQIGRMYVDLEADRLVIGSYTGDLVTFHRTSVGWVEEQLMRMPEPFVPAGPIGYPVALAGNSLAIGSHGAGRVDLMRFTGSWVPDGTLSASEVAGGFGAAIDLDGGLLAVGRPWVNRTDPSGVIYAAGLAYTYKNNDGRWEALAELRGPAVSGHFFGAAVAVDSEVNLVAVSGNGFRPAVHIFRVTGGSSLGSIAEPADTLGFGDTLAFDGRWLVVGAPRTNVFSFPAGIAFVYELTPGGVRLRQTLANPSPGALSRHFGASISIRDGALLIGANQALFAYEADVRGRWRMVRNLASDLDDPAVAFATTDGESVASMFNVWDRRGQGWRKQSTLVVREPSRGDDFGASVAVRDSMAAVGAPGDDTAQEDGGSVYLFKESADGWHQTGRLTVYEGFPCQGFGASVVFWGDIVAVGMPSLDSAMPRPGRVGLYDVTKNPPELLAYLAGAGPGMADYDRFGISLAATEEELFVGAGRDVNSSEYQGGVVFVYRRSASVLAVLSQVLTPPPGDRASGFGGSIDVDGDTLVIGADRRNTPGATAAGAVYIADRVGESWVVRPPVAIGRAKFSRLGASVAIGGDRIIAGAPNREGAALEPGYVLVLGRGSEWTPLREIRCATPDRHDHFGSHVRISGRHAIVGGTWNDRPIEIHDLDAPYHREFVDVPPGSRVFGTSIAVAPGRWMLAASENADSPVGVASGAVYAFREVAE
ncbi:FG-GAP repeat protein [Agromyces mariniharenae]|nr:FG-GAP repeat protein [Agromyces mariniharenae]